MAIRVWVRSFTVQSDVTPLPPNYLESSPSSAFNPSNLHRTSHPLSSRTILDIDLLARATFGRSGIGKKLIMRSRIDSGHLPTNGPEPLYAKDGLEGFSTDVNLDAENTVDPEEELPGFEGANGAHLSMIYRV